MGKSQKPAVIEKEEAKISAALEAAARRSKGKKAKSNVTYYAGMGSVIAVSLLGVFLAVSGPAKKGSSSPLDSYVNDQTAEVAARADGNFSTAASAFFNKWTLADVKWGHAGISLSNMVGISGAVQSCDVPEGVEGGAIPPSYDARDSWPGCFGAVYDSGNCSASYATAAADALSARFCIADNEKYNGLRLSAQQILSCDKKSRGCKGGGIDNVWSYIQRRGLYPEECLPYAGEKGAQCKTECKEEQKLKVLDHCVLTQEKAIKREVYNRGPVVAPMFLHSEYLVYKDGVYSPTEGSTPDFIYDANGKSVIQAVSILGWGKSHGNPYWLVRHSWGSGWGEDGYARVSMNTVLHENYIVVGTPATEAAIAAAELKKAEEAERREEAKKERALRDERIAENRRKMAEEKATTEEASDLDGLDDDDFESEVDLDAEVE